MTPLAPNAATSAGALRARQALVIALLFGGYASLYFRWFDYSSHGMIIGSSA